jgi:hypothetical protein
MISEKRDLGRFDDRDMFFAIIIDDVNCDLADVLRPGAGSNERAAKIAKRQARLGREITMTYELAVYVFWLLARDEHHFASRRDDDLGVHLGNRQIVGIYAFERH